jgi:hypothetical protein
MKLVIDTTEFKETLKLVSQWKQRARAVKSKFVYDVALLAYQDIDSRIPKKHSTLNKSLGLVVIEGLGESQVGYAIRAKQLSAPIGRSNAGTVVVHVSARASFRKALSGTMRVLEEYSPWTMDTLPIQPDEKTTIVITRKVSEATVDRVRKQRKRDRREWLAKLQGEGARRTRKERVGQDLSNMRAVSDLVFESLRIEFGLGGESGSPHWRPYLTHMASGKGPRVLSKQRGYLRAMTSLSFTGWRMWPPPVNESITVMRARAFVPFQERLGIRVSA